MTSFFTSEDMVLCQLLMHEENAFNCLVEVGHVGYLQFNNVYEEDHLINGIYTKKVTLCYDLLRIIEYLEEQMEELNISPTYYEKIDIEDRPRESQISVYEMHLRRMNTEMRSVMEHYLTLDRRQVYLEEKRYALQKGDEILLGNESAKQLYSDSTILDLLLDQSDATPTSSHLNYILGTILVVKFHAFELMLYRLFGRNLLVRRVEMPEIMQYIGHKRELVHKFVVLLMTTSESIKPKLFKVCSAFHVTIFECPETANQRSLMIDQLERDISDLSMVQNETLVMRKRILQMTAIDSYVMRINLQKSMKTYDLLNRLSPVGGRQHQKYLQAECYVPVTHLKSVRQALNEGALIEDTAGSINTSPPILSRITTKTKNRPPTYFALNKFTHGFQNLINAYGMADFKELNPAPYTIITFPFLFAVMFGDIGHGAILTLFALFLIIKEDNITKMKRTAKSDNEIVSILFSGRYIILLMGLFSIYVGFIYNDIMGFTINIFGSSWAHNISENVIVTMTKDVDLDPSDPQCYSGDPYPIGVDPIWVISGEDSINMFNSLKMKLAIILGLSQMMFGLALAAVNCFQRNREVDFYLIVLPQTIFMSCMFGYLVFLIFFKWLTYGGHKPSPYNAACAPSVLITFIDMMLMKTTEQESKNCNVGMFPFERTIEYLLILVALAMVPVMLAGKPIYMLRRHKSGSMRNLATLKSRGRDTLQFMRSLLNANIVSNNQFADMNRTEPQQQQQQNQQDQEQITTNEIEDEEEFDVLELWIHSGIHTIESVLGSVSHTASYLRLWALSLAHCQLSDVLLHMVFSKGLSNTLPIYLGVPVLMISFFTWALLTVAILIMMEGLSAFLHTLRLHWVEFQSKFFAGSGEIFDPFYFPPSTRYGSAK